MEGLEHEAERLVGRSLGEFVLREPLSSGGFGHVFLAEQTAMRREAVVKVLHERHTRDQTIVQRFLREARLATLLDHPYAAHTYAFGAEPDGVLWIAMELVRGTSLDRYLQATGEMELERFVPLLERICEVVETAHEQGIVHRDLKPANVMVLARAGQLLPKLLDFGIAKVGGDDALPRGRATTPPPVEDAALEPLTQAGSAMGSPTYMAPEMWVDSGAADARSDTYALGVMCYVALTGRPPFRAPGRAQLRELHARAAVPPLGRGFPAALDAVLARAMAKKPDDRFQTPLALAAAFRIASGVAAETVALPKLAEPLRAEVIASAPQPLAQAVMALEAARNAHQARDALWQLARVAVRLIGVVALAAHDHVKLDAMRADPAASAALRRLRERSLADTAWLEIARALVRPFGALRDAHPVPELVDLLLGEASRPLDRLLALRAEADEAVGRGEEEVRAVLARGLAVAEAALRALDFLRQYRMVVPGHTEREAEVWMGAPSASRGRIDIAGRLPATGRPALVDPAGVVVLVLWPFAQVEEPSPGAGRALFLIDGCGRRGARLTALPAAFEREDDELWHALDGLLAESPGEGGPPVDERCPLPGLAAFTAADAAGFVGRERETEEAVNRLRAQPLLAVVGPSGAGKSSFVQAGVLPALPDGWSAITVRPGPSPLGSLAARLRAGGVPEGGDLRDALAEDPDALGALLAASATPGGARVLVVDQLEEVFTLCEDEEERELFAVALAGATRSADDPVRVVVTLRDDFLVRAGSLGDLRARLGVSLQIVTTPAEPELRRIVGEPLVRAGYRFDDPELLDEIVAQVAHAPGALALLSFMVSRLWELRDRRFREISRKAYRSLGGVAGALAQHAEETLEAMSPPEQRLVREVFRHAVTAEGTRAVMSPAEMTEVLGGGPHATAVIEKLVAARLFVVSDAADAGGEQIEIAHETLLEAWPRLVTWRREDAEGARLRDQLRTAARQWDERGQPDGLLWRGDALAELRLWRTRHPGALTATEEAFAAASAAQAAAARRRKRVLIGAAFVVLGGVAVALLILNARAERQRALAQTSEREAEKSASDLEDMLRDQYEGQGRRLLRDDDPLQALAYLAKAAQHGARGPAHDLAVAQAVRSTDGEIAVLTHEQVVVRARFTPDGKRIVTSGYDRRARLWDAATGAMLADLPHAKPVLRLAVAPDGSVATASDEGVVKIWSPDGKLRRELAASGAVHCVEFTPDGAMLLTDTGVDEVRLWDAATGALVAELRPATENTFPLGNPCAISPDGARVAAGALSGRVDVWDTRTHERVAALEGHTDRLTSVRFSPDGQRLATASFDDTAIVWRPATRTRELTLRHRDDVNSVAWSPDGKHVVTASSDRSAIVWDATTGALVRALTGHTESVNLAIYSHDGDQIATTSDDTTAMLWDPVSGGRLAQRFGQSALGDVTFSPDGRRMVTASKDGSAIVWTTEPALGTLPLRGHRGWVHAAAFSPDGRQVATGSYQESDARIWDVSNGRQLFVLRGANDDVVTAVQYRPDGDELAVAMTDGLVHRWDPRTGRPIGNLGREEAPAVMALGWHPSGERVAAASADGVVTVWSLDGTLEREIVADAGQQLTGVAFTPSGTAIAVSSAAYTSLFDAATGAERWRVDASGRLTLRLDGSGAHGVSSTSERTAVVWRLADGAIASRLFGHTGQVALATWGPGDDFIVTASQDKTARVWDAATGEPLAKFTQAEPLYTAAISPTGERLVATGANGYAVLWDLPRYEGSAAELERLLRCRVPWDYSGERVVPRPRDLAACR